MEPNWRALPAVLCSSFVTPGEAAYASDVFAPCCPAGWPVMASRAHTKLWNPLRNPETLSCKWSCIKGIWKMTKGNIKATDCMKMGLTEGVTITSWAKSFIRVHYSSTSLLSCTARIVNSCPSYTKQPAFKTKQYLLFFKFSWSHLPSHPGTWSFIIPEHHHHHQAHWTVMILSPSTEPPGKSFSGKGYWLAMLTNWAMCALEA